MNPLDEKLRRIERLIGLAATKSLIGAADECNAILDEAGQMLLGIAPGDAAQGLQTAVLRQSAARVRVVGVGR